MSLTSWLAWHTFGIYLSSPLPTTTTIKPQIDLNLIAIFQKKIQKKIDIKGKQDDQNSPMVGNA